VFLPVLTEAGLEGAVAWSCVLGLGPVRPNLVSGAIRPISAGSAPFQTAIPRSGVPITASCDPKRYDLKVKIPCAGLLAIREPQSHRVRSTKFVGRQATHKL
jgi:hypothetical protein